MFSRFSKWISAVTGHATTFVLACLCVVIWLFTGPYFNYSDTWELVISTITNIVTFLMVFVIQSSQNRETLAVQIKLDELIRSIQGAHLNLLDIENLDDKQLEDIQKRYAAIVKRIDKKKDDIRRPEV